MPDGDRQLAFTTGPLPSSVQVSGADKLTPKTVNASFDGTGAAGAFLPCLIITGRTGHEVARIPGPQIAAGASAEVSWFPRVGGASAAAATTAREALQSNTPTTIVSGGQVNLDWNHLDGSSLLDTTNPQLPKVKAKGVYAITVTVVPSPLTIGARYRLQLDSNAPGTVFSVESSGVATAAEDQPWTNSSMILELTAGASVWATVLNLDAVACDFSIYPAVVQKVS